jgi:hypothetical protein
VELEVEDVDPDEAPPVAPPDEVDETPAAPPVEADVPVDAPLAADDAPALPAFDTDDPLAPSLAAVVVVVGKAVAAVIDWICMESPSFGSKRYIAALGLPGNRQRSKCPITGLSSR